MLEYTETTPLQIICDLFPVWWINKWSYFQLTKEEENNTVLLAMYLKCQSICAVAINIIHKKSLEQVGDLLSLLFRQFFSNPWATIQAFGCKPSGVSFMGNTHLKDIHFLFSLGAVS